MGELIPLEGVGSKGLITDIPPWQLEMGTWSDGNNIRFDDVSVKKMPGYEEVMETVPEPPLHLDTYQLFDSQVYYWLAFCKNNIYVYSGNTWLDITPDPAPNGDGVRQWQTTKLGAVIVATNGVDAPYWWPLVNGIPSTSVPFAKLEHWPDDWENAQTIAGFKSFLFAGSLYDNTTNIQMNRLIAWSDMSNQYTPPESWDILDPDGDAGTYELLDSEGPVVHLQQLREAMMVYKTDSVVTANFIGAPFMFGFQVLSPDVGIMCKNAVADYPGGHFFMGRSDCYINNGQSIAPILSQKIRRKVYENIDGTAFAKSFAVTDWANNEVWACYPTVNSEYCDRALIWNFVNNTFTIRDLPQSSHIKSGIAPINLGATWDQTPGEWDASPNRWGTDSYDSVVENLVIASTGDGKTYRHDAGDTEDGTPMTSWVERTGIDLGDPSSVKHVQAVWPKVWTRGANTVIKVFLGYQMNTEDPVTWEGPVLFNPNTMNKISTRTTGKLFAIRMESDTVLDWYVSGIEYEIVPAGRRGSRRHV